MSLQESLSLFLLLTFGGIVFGPILLYTGVGWFEYVVGYLLVAVGIMAGCFTALILLFALAQGARAAPRA